MPLGLPFRVRERRIPLMPAKPAFDLDWIEPFVERIRPHVFVRLSDCVLIRMPNEAFKLNPTGAKLLDHLLKGGRLKDVLDARKSDPEAPVETGRFFADLSRMLGDGLCDAHESPSLERVPFELGYIELPVLSEVALTWRCNVRCRFCYAACEYAADGDAEVAPEELGTAQVKRVLSILRHEAEVPSVSFTGGEPTLRGDLAELIAYASGTLRMRVNLITNGTRIDSRVAESYRAAGLASAQVSIESPEEKIHDAIAGVPGAFKASVRGLMALKDAGVAAHPHSTLCRLNRESLPRMASLAKSLSIDRFSANLIIPAGRGSDPELALRYSEVDVTLQALMRAAREAGVRFLWYSPTPVCLFNPVPHRLGNKGCSACEGLLSIDPFGRLLPCSSWREPVGNILESGFKALWFGERARFLREKRAAHPKCRPCEHFALCQGACPLYFQVYGYEELEPEFARMDAAAPAVPR
jgi:radical SAM protein with 4Fe4S-binding SPASM domain